MTKKRVLILVPLVILLGMIVIYFLFPEAMFRLLIKVERRVAGLQQRNINVNGLRIEYLQGGEGDALLLLHGFGANKDSWTRIAKYLTSNFRVIAPDLTGFGESSPDPNGDYSIKAQVTRVKAFVQSLGIGSFHLGGSSMGGYIAGTYASIYPKDLKSLLLISPGGIVTSETSEMMRRMNKGEPNPLIAGNVEDYNRLLDFVFVKKPFIPLPIKKLLIKEAIEHQQLNREIFKQLRNSIDATPLETLLKGLSITSLIVWGAQDRVLHVSGAKILEAVLPNARAEIMEAVGHLPMIEKPEGTAMLYLRLLELQ